MKNTRSHSPAKNARIADKILLSLPIELTLEQRTKAVRAFLWELTGHGKTRALACFHDQGGSNPQAHIYLVDKDMKTGKAVFRTSEPAPCSTPSKPGTKR